MDLEEINFHNNFQQLGDLFLKWSERDKEKADKLIKALNEIYFYSNSLRIRQRETDGQIDAWKNKYYELADKFKDFM